MSTMNNAYHQVAVDIAVGAASLREDLEKAFCHDSFATCDDQKTEADDDDDGWFANNSRSTFICFE